ncbi:alpha-2,3-sialyltransferase [Helicobacter bizzozeronii]|uniref:alpha-2,3-sialyltransferase n=1 Tax=Helicobacter bizzozeronii TaxID=56877 RepID=UPI00244D8A16|nr:alpha-2,3-sialyltransferase [Helicobacter bizzozeronii]GMB93368.1 alpha-2,3-sialyltransferase [Helicobacter bizzozeronii]
MRDLPPLQTMKPLIVAGNGPSIKNLDYSLFPPDFDVFRCNQFYFEDKYYLGKEVKGAFFTFGNFDLQMNTAHILHARGEYNFTNFYCSAGKRYICSHYTPVCTQDFLDRRYVGVRATYNLFEKIEPFFSLYAAHGIFDDQWITSGVGMLICAIALGYQEIYLVGIDLYIDGPGYFYAHKSAYFESPQDNPAHSKELDTKAIKLAQQYAQLYVLVPNTPLAQILPLSPHKNALSIETKERLKLGEAKPTDYIGDVCFIPAHGGYKENIRWLLFKHGMHADNFVFQSLRFGYHVCQDLYQFVRACLALCTPKNLKLIFKRHKHTR